MLIGGLLLWSAVHYIPGMMPDLRVKLIDKLGAGPYKGLFALSIIGSIVLIVFGWKATTPEFIYQPPSFGPMVTMLLMIFALFLFGCSHGTANIKRVIRHPQLTAVIVWASAHLFSNGDKRSIILFGGMIIWAVTEILVINKRDGEWQKQGPVSWGRDLKIFAIGLVVYVALIFGHPYFTGFPVVST